MENKRYVYKTQVHIYIILYTIVFPRVCVGISIGTHIIYNPVEPFDKFTARKLRSIKKRRHFFFSALISFHMAVLRQVKVCTYLYIYIFFHWWEGVGAWSIRVVKCLHYLTQGYRYLTMYNISDVWPSFVFVKISLARI